ncbi:MAG: glycosyltransferase [Saprospiraceae bacterium]|nr:glycosyltransferase [Saprospiraceae bacterium]
MQFQYFPYISPTWYFNLKPKAGDIPYFTDYRKLPEAARSLIDYDAGYSSEYSSLWDAAYQAWHKGVIETDADKTLTEVPKKPGVADNYRFIRKYFHPLWSWYVLALRLVTLHNPFREISGFRSQRGVRRIDLFKNVYPHEQAFKSFESALLQQAPKVSVIIPTLNRYPYLKDALHDLEKQDYPNFDVIVVDQSEPYQQEFYEAFDLDIKLIRQEEKALWLARNTAVKTSDAEYLLLYDDDSRTEPDWISQHIKCLDYFDADISSGVSISMVGAKVPANYAFFRWGDQLDTGNAMVRREVFRRVGLFDRQFEGQRMGDGEFGLRAYLAGFKNVSNPLAGRLHLKVGSGGLRQMGSWDAFRPKSLLAPRPVPSVLYLTRKYFGERAARHLLLTSTAPSVIPYRYKGNKLMMLLSIPLSLLLLPFVVVQVWRAYHISSAMVKEGARIEGRLEMQLNIKKTSNL